MEKFTPMHQHLLIKARIKEPLNDVDVFKEMLKLLVLRLGMIAVTPPQARYIDTPGNEGMTGSINLATSHIALHIWDDDLRLMADIYSCCPYDSDSIVKYLGFFFGGYSELEYIVIDRDTFNVTDAFSDKEVS